MHDAWRRSPLPPGEGNGATPFWRVALIALLMMIVAPVARAENPTDYYKIETVPLPKDVVGETDGLDFLPDGKLAVCFYREGVWFYDPAKQAWSQFAYGLHEPLGLKVISEHEVVVLQRPELTRLIDTDKDGKADEFKTICDAWGMSGNYHEFAFGPAVGPDGMYYVSLNCASSGAGIFKELRGEYREDGRPGRMYSCVPYRGWVVRIDPKTGEMTPWAYGFRSPNGIGFDAKGNLFVPDNQGDWIGTSPVYHVKRGNFYGHAASLVWSEGWDRGVPSKLPVAELDKMRTRPAVQLPHGILANSPTQVVPDNTGGKFGPFAGQVLVGEMNHSTIIRVAFDEVAGELQGAAIPLITTGLSKGINRFAFAPDGSLWVGHTERAKGWGGGKGINRITWTGKTPLDVLTMKLADDGYDLTFTEPLDPNSDAAKPEAYKLRRYYYEYHEKYGSDQYDVNAVDVLSATLSADHRTVSLKLPELKAGYIYDLTLGDGIKSADGAGVLNKKVYHTCTRLRDGTVAPPQIPDTRIVPKLDPKKLESSKPADVKKISVSDDASVYEAESANVFGARVDHKNPGYTGKGFVDYGANSGESIVWLIDVKKDDAGRHKLAFRYALEGGSRPLELAVNDKTIGNVKFDATGGWATWKTVDATADLTPGRNTIQLKSIGSSGPNVDHLQVLAP
ncbi:MAG: carbohydrate-binding protein [Phycisphaera sp.]|nr:carbohydrate-binding protein [Phycisphaera sp.]